VREPRRVAFALAAQLAEEHPETRAEVALLGFDEREQRVLGKLVADGVASPWTSSIGRLFDGVAAFLGLPGRVSFEGEAAMLLEALAASGYSGTYSLPLVEVAAPAALAPGQRARPVLLELDWRPMLAEILGDRRRGVTPATIAARFHAALADAGLDLARRAGLPRVALTGGCFQNRRLTAETARRLRDESFTVLIHREVPPNDGGIALGQVAVARARLAGRVRRIEPCASEFRERSSPSSRTRSAMPSGRVEFGGIVKEVCFAYTPTSRWAITSSCTSASRSRRSTRRGR
jgi:hydrogenase maturation protein HypF